jgi:hypothetical protein
MVRKDGIAKSHDIPRGMVKCSVKAFSAADSASRQDWKHVVSEDFFKASMPLVMIHVAKAELLLWWESRVGLVVVSAGRHSQDTHHCPEIRATVSFSEETKKSCPVDAYLVYLSNYIAVQ